MARGVSAARGALIVEITYDPRDYCRHCGQGASQRAPFRLWREPRWGRRSLLQLHWVFDEYFAHPDAWEQVLRPLGIAARPVLQHPSGAPLQTVVQWDVGCIASAFLALGAHPAEDCPHCGRSRYLPFTRGFFPPFRGPVPEVPVMKTREYFGSGGRAYRQVIIPNTVYRAIAAAGLRGCHFLLLLS